MGQTSGLEGPGMASRGNKNLGGWSDEGAGTACVGPQMREGERVETGGHICLQQQERSKRGFHQRLFLD